MESAIVVDTSSNKPENEQNDLSDSIPPVNERLGKLRPSKELLEYYRKKIAEYDCEQEALVKKLSTYKETVEEEHHYQWELRQREEEILELQSALSDMQVYLFQERENILRLHSENDRLKLQELTDRKKIQQLLSLERNSVGTEISYFHRKPPADILLKKTNELRARANVAKPLLDHSTGKGHKNRKTYDDNIKKLAKDEGVELDGNDVETLLLQVESLQAQQEESTKLAKDQINALLEDRNIRIEEQSAFQKRTANKIQVLTERLRKTQDLLYESTKDFLELRYETKFKEREWMLTKDKMLQELEELQQSSESNGNSYNRGELTKTDSYNEEAVKQHMLATNSLKEQLMQAEKLADMYREQCINFEDELYKLHEQEDVSRELFRERTEKLSKRLTLMNQRYLALEKRRALEVEGFKSDIKILRNRLKDLEKQIFKVTVDTISNDDARALLDIRQSAGMSKLIVDALKELKAKMYSLENKLRNV